LLIEREDLTSHRIGKTAESSWCAARGRACCRLLVIRHIEAGHGSVVATLLIYNRRDADDLGVCRLEPTTNAGRWVVARGIAA